MTGHPSEGYWITSKYLQSLLRVTQIKMPVRLMQKKKKTLGTLGIGRDREMGTLILGGNINWIAFGEAIW